MMLSLEEQVCIVLCMAIEQTMCSGKPMTQAFMDSWDVYAEHLEW